MVTNKKRRGRRIAGRVALALVAICVVLIFDLRPALEAPRAPQAAEAERARNVVRNARDALRDGKGVAWVSASGDDLKSAAVLASWLRSFGRFDAAIEGETLNLRGSRALGPLWLNAFAVVEPKPKGFPQISLTIGRLPLGTTLTRWGIELARHVLRWRGAAVPPLNDLVRGMRVGGGIVSAQVHFPLNSGLADQLSGVRERPIDAATTVRIYCRLVAEDLRAPTDDLALLVRRAFADRTAALPPVEQHRAAFVALAMYTVAPSAGRLAGNANERAATCPTTRKPPLLAGRDDLAKHWALSAALASALGDDVGKAMGEWKELADSRPGGTGFSFVDLSADRAGLAAARAATDPNRAENTAARLRLATQNDLLPLKALALSEGMTEAQFVAGYRDIDSGQFARTKDRIDAIIASTVGS